MWSSFNDEEIYMNYMFYSVHTVPDMVNYDIIVV